MIVGGFLNVSRARHSDGLTRAFSAIGNLLILGLAVGIAAELARNLRRRDVGLLRV
jgi:hypothetical protein